MDRDLMILAAAAMFSGIGRKYLARVPHIGDLKNDDLRRVLRWTQFWSVAGGIIFASAVWILLNESVPVWFSLCLVSMGWFCIEVGSHPKLQHWTEPGNDSPESSSARLWWPR